MKKVFLKEGYVIFPEDWIILPDIYDSPDKCLYAGVVESRNSEKYKIPHFVFFSNYRYGADYPTDLDDKVLSVALQCILILNAYTTCSFQHQTSAEQILKELSL